MYFYAARQPILDKNKTLFAYELLFRDSLENVFPNIDGDEATSKMIEASQFNMGVSEFTGKKPAFINFTLETLNKGYSTMLTNEEVVIEILETIKPGKKLLEHCKDLHSKGYTVALDDYIHQGVWAHFYPYINIIKIDIQSEAMQQLDDIKLAIAEHPHIKLLAEKVETYEEYQTAIDEGFEYFQGYFFAKPEVVKTKSLTPSQMAVAELLYETSKPDLDLPSIIAIFERDVSLSYKLLRYANSAIFRRRAEIATIKQALITLGFAELKRFLGLMFTSNINPDKPNELIRLSMTRAKFCEELAENDNQVDDVAMAFLTGLMSLIDAILDESMEEIFEKLPLASEIKDALVGGKGRLAEYVQLVIEIENANWDHALALGNELNLSNDKLSEIYADAITWSNEQAKITCGEPEDD